MTDLTAITAPFGLLDRETQEALKAHGGPYEIYEDRGWCGWIGPLGDYPSAVMRVKPAPQKPREWWLVRRPDGVIGAYQSFEDADNIASMSCFPIIHVVEKLP